MAKITVYNSIYHQGFNEDPIQDALFGSPHEVIGRSATMRQAVEQMLDLSKNHQPEDQPDLIIFGDKLNDEHAYAIDPVADSEPCSVSHRAWHGGKKEVIGVRKKFLLPYYTGLGEWEFPVVEGVDPAYPAIATDSIFKHHGSGGSILSKVAKVYLPNAKRLGFSSSTMSGDADLDAEVRRDQSDHVIRLRAAIEQLTSGTASD
jgi:hypothetical protein